MILSTIDSMLCSFIKSDTSPRWHGQSQLESDVPGLHAAIQSCLSMGEDFMCVTTPLRKFSGLLFPCTSIST